MTPAPFDYLRPESLEEALACLAENGDDAAVMAGGQSLVPMLALRLARPAVVVDIGGLPGLDGIAQEDETVWLGPLLRHRVLERDGRVARAVPLLARAAGWVATPAIRNAGTLGGALALGDPAAEYPAVALALGARLRLISGAGMREVAAHDFFLGAMETAIEPGELLAAVGCAAPRPDDLFGFAEIAQRRGDYAMAGAALARRGGPDGGLLLALFGVAGMPVLIVTATAGLARRDPASWDDDLLRAFGADVAREVAEIATAPFKTRLAGVAAMRAARDLAGRAPDMGAAA